MAASSSDDDSMPIASDGASITLTVAETDRTFEMDYIDELEGNTESAYVYTPVDGASDARMEPLTAANLNVLQSQITDNGSTPYSFCFKN